MKKMLTQKILQFLINWLRSRFARGFRGKSKFGSVKPSKSLSYEHVHLLKISQLVKTKFRQKGWKMTVETITAPRAAEIVRRVRERNAGGSGGFSSPAQK